VLRPKQDSLACATSRDVTLLAERPSFAPTCQRLAKAMNCGGKLNARVGKCGLPNDKKLPAVSALTP